MGIEEKYWYLKNHKLFEQLSSEEIERLNIISNMKHALKNEIIFFSEAEIKKIYIIKKGILKICRDDENGKEIITEILTEGDLFGQISNIVHKQERAKVLSDEVNLCYFEVSNFRKVLESNNNLSISFANMISEKLISFQQKYEDLIFKNVQTRLINFYRRYAQHHGVCVNQSMEMEIFLTHQEIADYIAASRQSVTTSINQLIEEGLIIYEGRKKVIIPNFISF